MTAPFAPPTITLGIAGGSTPVTANLTADHAQWNLIWITLLSQYVQVHVPDFLYRTDSHPHNERRMIGRYIKGQRVQFWAVEAAAIVAAGIGAYS
jgi:hypothetical protein